MIPSYLKIKGLYSYQTEQEIDFAPLTDAALFGVFGAVGSGKSSILEAITFALYGDTERLNKSGDDRTYNMMNLRSDELLIDFECVAGKQGDRYKFTVKGKRNSKNFKDVKTFERRLYKWEDEAWIPLPETESTESIIGLSYDNFRRTIIIPQGRFQEFIELRDAERTKMMKELFQLEKYDLSRNVGSLSKQNDISLSNLDGQLTSLGEVTEELIQSENTKKTQVQEEIKKIQAELLVQTSLETKYQNLKAMAEKGLLLRRQLAVLQEKQPEMQTREAALKTFETCSLHFKSLFDQKKNLAESLTRDENQLKQYQARNQELVSVLEKQKEILTQLRPRYADREKLLDTAEELEKVLQIKANTSAADKRREALKRGEIQLLEKENAIELLKTQRQVKESENDLLKSNVADIQEMSVVMSWFTTYENLLENRTLIKKEADQLQEGIAQQQKLLTESLDKIRISLVSNLAEQQTAESFQADIQRYLQQNDNDRRALNVQLLKVNTRAALQQFAGALHDGEACPLCGSAHHPDVLHQDDSIQKEAAEIEQKIEKLDEKSAAARKMQTSVERIFNQIENLEKQKASIRERWIEIKEKLDGHDQSFVWPNFNKTDRQGFEKQFQEANQKLAQIRDAESVLKKLSRQIDLEVQEKTDKVEKPLLALRDEILRLDNTVSTLVGQLVIVDFESFREENERVITEKVDELKKNYAEITTLFEQTEKQVDGFEKEKDILSGSITTLQNAVEGSVRNMAAVGDQISVQLSRFGFSAEEEVLNVLNQTIQIDTERKELDTFRFALETTSRDLDNHLKEAPNEEYDLAAHEMATRAKDLLMQALDQQRKEEGGLDRLINNLVKDLAKKNTLQQQKDKLQLRKQHLDDLTRLFRSSGFVDYASSIYLQNLIQAANHRFHQMTHQQLHLELGEGNSFWVRDLLNGGHMRLLKTLSGGQKFQAALSLALALADHIHIRNESKHNFFFLDEGFGSLDKNALQTVFDTLKSLRKENRIVGIISHVEDLQQEIQTYLKVTEEGEGSRIVPSWK